MQNHNEIKTTLSFIIIIFCLLLSGCQVGPTETGGGEVELRVTTGYGQEVLFADTVVAQPGQSVLVLLQQHLDVDYAYGGRFVNSIEGIRSGYTSGSKKEDWFFYANGILCGSGAGDYYPQNGDVIWWDYYSWDGSLFVPAVTGAFPQPFVNGYKGSNAGTLIMHGKENEHQAVRIKSFLKEHGVNDIEVLPYREEYVSTRNLITMVIAPWRELKSDSFWLGLQSQRDKSGWFVEFDGEKIIPLDESGERSGSVKIADGAIVATGSGMGDEHPLWLVTAADEYTIDVMLSIIIDSPDSIAGTMGTVMINNEMIPLPVSWDRGTGPLSQNSLGR